MLGKTLTEKNFVTKRHFRHFSQPKLFKFRQFLDFSRGNRSQGKVPSDEMSGNFRHPSKFLLLSPDIFSPIKQFKRCVQASEILLTRAREWEFSSQGILIWK